MALKGERLDRPTYDILKSSLGNGTTGEVILTFHEIFGKEIVQKTVSLLGNPDGVAKSEPRVLESLDHPHLINVREAQWDPEKDLSLECITFTSDYYPGRCIHHALSIDGHRFSVGDTLAIVEGILDALNYLHETRNLLHRDIKPPNVMLDEARRHAYVGDLGSAATRDAAGQAKPYGGTPLYQPPEAAAGTLDVRSDLYGVGAVMVEMLNGPHDYENIDRDSVDRRLALGRRALPDRFYRPAPWVPAPVVSVLRRLVAAKPADRYQSAHEALRAVRDIRCVSWVQVSGGGLVGCWQGNYPTHLSPAQTRVYQVTAAPVTSGRHAGMVSYVARWRHKDAVDWRNYASLATRAPEDDDRALAAFFREVEAKAHSAPTSRR
ncbi:hypothetical protein ASD11_15045 [Aeromicrobium sp. Root495]|uniref:serine/threonine-protein kinase n=1 Tax=Aeromicrobium sp. Root495 TaxID=1736550 RepID=UPI0006F46556|nr:serine/threonine-protein kinase [Aeromicrobium sp. Root495]KQY55818.1 hypothetical protein ASD11_15045 [Aeromicrobium sp. Root495]